MAKSESDGATSVDTARELTRALRSDTAEITIVSPELTTVILGKYRDRILHDVDAPAATTDGIRVRPAVPAAAPTTPAPAVPSAPRRMPSFQVGEMPAVASKGAEATKAPRRRSYGRLLAFASLPALGILLAALYLFVASPATKYQPNVVPAPPSDVVVPLPTPPPSSGGPASFPVPPWSLVALVGMVLFYLVLRQLLKQESYEIDASWQIYQVKGKLKLVKVKTASVKIKA